MGVAQAFNGCGFVHVCYPEAIFIEKSHWEFESCPLSRIKKRPFLGGQLALQLF